jgi:hypothetical protein
VRCAAAFPARLAASRIRWCAQYGAYVYTRLRVRPDGGGTARGVRLPCPQVATSGE